MIAYVADFHLLAYDVLWDEEALMDHFHYGLWNDVKDSLLTLAEDPRALTEAMRHHWGATMTYSSDVESIN